MTDLSANHQPLYQTSRPGPPLQLGRIGRLEWNTVELPIAGLPAGLHGFRLLHLSDIHLRGRWEPGFDEILTRTAANPPDLVAMTGDYVDASHALEPSLPILRKLFLGLRSKLGTFGILGNHDSDILQAYLPTLGIHFISGQQLLVGQGDHPVELIGLPGAHRRDLDGRFFPGLPPKVEGVPRIVLGHFPDQIRRAGETEPDVFLAGHTHGGQCCLPGRRAIIRHDQLPRPYAHGVHRWNDRTWLVVHRGMGFSLLPIRIFCPAEVVEITLRRE